MQTDNRHADLLLQNVVHDLRQPLSIIQASVFHLNTMLCEHDSKAALLIEIIQRQIEQAAAVLSTAAAAAKEPRRAYCLEPVVSADRTNETTAALT